MEQAGLTSGQHPAAAIGSGHLQSTNIVVESTIRGGVTKENLLGQEGRR